MLHSSIVCVVWESDSNTHQAESASELFGLSFKFTSSRITHINTMKFNCRRQGDSQKSCVSEPTVCL